MTANGEAEDQKLGPEVASKLKTQPELANNVAWAMLTDKNIVHRDTELAAQIARLACESSQWKKAVFIDTYARALFEAGKKDDAIAQEEKAVALSPADEKATYERTLKSYKEGKLPAAAE